MTSTAGTEDAAVVSAASSVYREDTRPRSVRLAGLDGLRAVAVGGVLAYHAGWRWLPGGFLGVDLFFVISGFLITSLLISERQRTGAISIGRFYLRRARRLLPALVTMVAGTTAFMAMFFRSDLAEARGDVVAAAGYFSNWWYVLHHRSYFAAAGRQPPLQHLWSLAVEEQFYLLWPLLLVVLLASRVRLRWVLFVAVLGAVGSAWWMRVLAVRGNVPFDTGSSRLYFGTDTHASALLLGAAGAVVVAILPRRSGLPRRWQRFGRFGRFVGDLVGLASLGWVAWALHRENEVSPGLYRGGFFVFAAVALVLVVSASSAGSRLGAALDVAPMRWIGSRSYGLYLWHWPVFVYTRPGLDWPLHGWADFAVRMAITLVLTELTFRLVERPIRERGLAGYFRARHVPRPGLSVRPWKDPRWAFMSRSLRAAAPIVGALCGTVLVVAATAFVSEHARTDAAQRASSYAPDTAARSADESSAVPGATSAPPAVSTSPTAAGSHTPTPAAKPAPSTASRQVVKTAPPVPAGKSSATPPPIPTGPPPPVTAVGDSVMVDGSVALQHACPGTEVYAVVGWQAKSVFSELAALRQAGHLGAVVILGTGTNGLVSSKELDAVLATLADRRVVVVNNHMDRPWEPPNNAMFPSVVKAHPNAVLVDWDTAANHHPEWLGLDGVHLTPGGRAPYAALLKSAAGC